MLENKYVLHVVPLAKAAHHFQGKPPSVTLIDLSFFCLRALWDRFSLNTFLPKVVIEETVVAAADKIVLEWSHVLMLMYSCGVVPLIYGGAKKQEERRHSVACPSDVISKKMVFYRPRLFSVMPFFTI